MNELRIGTRRSRLAMWQTETVAAALRDAHPGLEVTIVPIVTMGDRNTDAALSNLGATGVFTREIEVALLDNTCDLAVHSYKDLGTVMPEGLAVGAVLEREDPRDAFISRTGVSFDDLPAGALIGTSSLRRKSLLMNVRDDLRITNLRGNVHTRLRAAGRQVEGGKEPVKELDATILAMAGLKRLGLGEHAAQLLDVERFTPAPAQGTIAIQIRSDDPRTQGYISVLEHEATRLATTAERTFLNVMEGGCQLPVGAFATVDEAGEISLRATVMSLDGSKSVAGQDAGTDPVVLGQRLANALREQGGNEILEEVRAALDAQ